MKLWRETEEGEIPKMGQRWNTGDKLLVPVPINTDPDAVAKAAYEALHEGFEFERYEFKESFRKVAKASILAGVPSLVAENEALRIRAKTAEGCADIAEDSRVDILRQYDIAIEKIKDLEGSISTLNGWLNGERDLTIQQKARINELELKLAELTAPKAPELVSFDIERWEAGERDVVYRNGEKPKGVTIMDKAWPDDCAVMSVSESERFSNHYTDGRFVLNPSFDLLMPAPVKRMKTLYLDVKLQGDSMGKHELSEVAASGSESPRDGWVEVEIQIPA